MNPMTTTGPGPFLVVDSPHETARWRPIVNWVLYIPHAVILYALQALSRAVFLVYWLVLLFTGRLQPGLYGIMVMYERYNARAGGFLVGWCSAYPPFEFTTAETDNESYRAVRLDLPPVPAAAPRSAALNVFKAIPHYLLLMVFLVGAVVVAIAAWFAVLFTGSWPAGMRRYLIRVSNYQYRIWTYVTMVDNDYPTFGLPTA